MQNPVSSSLVPSDPAPKKISGNIDYIALDFQPLSQSPHHKLSTSSLTSDEKVETEVEMLVDAPGEEHIIVMPSGGSGD